MAYTVHLERGFGRFSGSGRRFWSGGTGQAGALEGL